MVLDWNKYVETARQVSAEGCVLLKNEAHTLPLQEGCRVAVFGRIQNNYYKSGTGSGGMVNVSNVTGILDALREEPGLSVDETVRETYEKWEKENPFDEGIGWANEPWSKVEMPLEEEFVRDASLRNNMALVIIGRTAGEDRDNVDAEGAYQLSKREIDMIEKVTSYFEKTAGLPGADDRVAGRHGRLFWCRRCADRKSVPLWAFDRYDCKKNRRLPIFALFWRRRQKLLCGRHLCRIPVF